VDTLTLGETLSLLRRRKVLTLEELANEAGVTVSTLSRLENDLQTPRPSTLRKVAKALGVDPSELVFEERMLGKIAA